MADNQNNLAIEMISKSQNELGFDYNLSDFEKLLEINENNNNNEQVYKNIRKKIDEMISEAN
jgi:hypothetical protein